MSRDRPGASCCRSGKVHGWWITGASQSPYIPAAGRRRTLLRHSILWNILEWLFGLLASGVKANNLVLARKLLDVAPPAPEPEDIAPSRPRPLSPARAAARPCASSRCSRQASLRNTGRPRRPTPSGSTPPEFGQRPLPPLVRSVSLVQDRPRQRSSEPAPRKARIGLGPLLPSQPSPVATTVWLRDHSARHVISGRLLSSRVEIPIAPAATLRPTSRGVLP